MKRVESVGGRLWWQTTQPLLRSCREEDDDGAALRRGMPSYRNAIRAVGTDMMPENTRADSLGLLVESREGEVVFPLPQTLCIRSVVGCRAILRGVCGEW